MSLWQSRPQAEPSSFPFHLEQAARAASPSHSVSKAPGAVLWAVAANHLGPIWQWLQRTRAAQTASRRLRVTETVSLGEKRFVSLVQVDGAQFLIGGSATSVQLLAHLKPQPDSSAQAMDEIQEPA